MRKKSTLEKWGGMLEKWAGRFVAGFFILKGLSGFLSGSVGSLTPPAATHSAARYTQPFDVIGISCVYILIGVILLYSTKTPAAVSRTKKKKSKQRR